MTVAGQLALFCLCTNLDLAKRKPFISQLKLSMTLEVRSIVEDEIEAWNLVAIDAFKDGIGHLLVGPNTLENRQQSKANTIQAMHEDPCAHFLKVVDTASGEMIAVAGWNIYAHGNTEEDLDKITARPTPERGYRADFEPIYEHLKGNRRHIMGQKPYLYLNLLSTRPTHHRRGAGSMLIKWGLDRADELGVEAYHESSIEGRPLYERFGYKVIKEVKFDMAQYGRPDLGVDVNCIMYREAQSKSSTT